jgi:hypothetical protein
MIGKAKVMSYGDIVGHKGSVMRKDPAQGVGLDRAPCVKTLRV